MAASIEQKTHKQKRRAPQPRFIHQNCISVTVKFIDTLPINQVVEKIRQASNPQIILWYIGCYGLSEVAVRFYRENLIHPVLSHTRQATFWLTDLSAWSAFKDPHGSIEKTHSCCEQIAQSSPL